MIVKSRLVKRFVEPVLGDGLHLPCFHSPLFLLSSSTNSHFYSFPLLVIPILLLLSNSLNRHTHSLTHTQMLANTHTHTHMHKLTSTRKLSQKHKCTNLHQLALTLMLMHASSHTLQLTHYSHLLPLTFIKYPSIFNF